MVSSAGPTTKDRGRPRLTRTKYLISSQNKFNSLKRVREDFFGYCCLKPWGQFQHPASIQTEEQTNFHYNKASGQCIAGIKLTLKWKRDLLKLGWSCAAGTVWTWPAVASFPSYGLRYIALWGCLSATEHGFVFDIISVILHTTSTPKSIFASCASSLWSYFPSQVMLWMSLPSP